MVKKTLAHNVAHAHLRAAGVPDRPRLFFGDTLAERLAYRAVRVWEGDPSILGGNDRRVLSAVEAIRAYEPTPEIWSGTEPGDRDQHSESDQQRKTSRHPLPERTHAEPRHVWTPDSMYEEFVIPSPGRGQNGPRANEIGVICCSLVAAGLEKLRLAEAGTADGIYESGDETHYRQDVQSKLSADQNHDEVLLATMLQLSIDRAVDTATSAANRHSDSDPALLLAWEALCWGLRTNLVACNQVDSSWQFRDQSLAQSLIDNGFNWLAATLGPVALSSLSPRVRGHEYAYPKELDAAYWPSWLAHRLACRASKEGAPLGELDIEVARGAERKGPLPDRLAGLSTRAYEEDTSGAGMISDPRWWQLARAGAMG